MSASQRWVVLSTFIRFKSSYSSCWLKDVEGSNLSDREKPRSDHEKSKGGWDKFRCSDGGKEQ
ncbi:uncharacterized protein G2W53_029396 [Senna tora]|uniref:Uncharacterized protein n=1 Tax=Senna tora TaxID=362788 RepID=A0A834T572_9FABA|nr:uncharacterized protein G2W53_029396 [Senna tora]